MFKIIDRVIFSQKNIFLPTSDYNTNYYKICNGGEEMISLSIKRLRENAGLTQQQVADMLNIDRSTYAYYEIGKTSPSINSLKKLAQIFNVSYEVLIDGASKYILADNRVQYRTIDFSDEKFYALSKEEKTLVTLFRLFSADEQTEILQKMSNDIARKGKNKA